MSTTLLCDDNTMDESNDISTIATDNPDSSVIQPTISSNYNESSDNDSLLAESIIRFRLNLHRNEGDGTTIASQPSDHLSIDNDSDIPSSGLRDSIYDKSKSPEKSVIISDVQYLPRELINPGSTQFSDQKSTSEETSQITVDLTQESSDAGQTEAEPSTLSRHSTGTISALTDAQTRHSENESEQYSQPIAAFRVPAESDPVQAIPVLNDRSEQKQFGPNAARTRMIIIVLATLIAISMIVAATAGGLCASGVISCGASTSSKIDSSVNSTIDKRSDSIYTYINTVTLSDDDSQNRSIYTTQAIDWIVHLDPLKLSVQNNTFRIRQRYALLSFWFHTTINNAWYNTDGWLDNDDECTWYGITCTEIDYGAEVGNQNTVTILNISSNNLVGMIPPDLSLLSRLRRMYLNNNVLSDVLPKSIGQLTDLEHLQLQFNNITGTLPESFVKLNKLTYVDLSYNYLTGALPTNIGNLSDMYYFSANTNQFTSTLPSSLGLWTNLNTIDFNFNHLFGSLPDEIENWREIEFILVLANELTGTLPSGIIHLTNIIGLDVSHNHFVGTIPENIMNWEKIYALQLQGNNFTGSVPSGICFTNFTVLIADCNLICECCSNCE